MTALPLAGRLILLVEDDPVVALDVEKALRAAGAKVVSAGYVESGLCTTTHPDLSAAVLDVRLWDGEGTTVGQRLRHRGVPFLLHTGYPPNDVAARWPDVPVVKKPARPGEIVAELNRLLNA